MLNREKLRKLILRSLRRQGFAFRDSRIAESASEDKEKLRGLHIEAVSHRVEQARAGLERAERRLLSYIASGKEVRPDAISPRLVEVLPDSEDELLFRYARLHWSVPVSAGYGRRLRFVVYDDSNKKLIGIIGLCDPVFALRPRDNWIGWDFEAKRERMQCTMEAFVLGAVPPYSQLLCGKLVALLLSSNEIRKAFKRKYSGRSSFIHDRSLDGRLAMISTNSALGRSSIYNRLRLPDGEVFHSVGFTQGSGEFHFSNGVYRELREYGLRYCDPTAKHERWGLGFRNKRELIRKVLPKLNLPLHLNYHRVRREVFVVPLARNSQAFLRGDHSRLLWFDRPASEIFDWFRERWLLPRAGRDKRYAEFDARSFRLWPTREVR